MADSNGQPSAAPIGDTPVDELSFEEALEELEATVEQLEGDGLKLDASLALYERGVALSERCNELLEGAELQVRELAADGSDGGALEL